MYKIGDRVGIEVRHRNLYGVVVEIDTGLTLERKTVDGPLDRLRPARGELVDRRSQLTEIRWLAELEGDLGSTDEVDAEVEPRSEEFVSEPADDRQRRKRQGNFAVREKRNIGVANDTHGFIQSDTEALDAFAPAKHDHVDGAEEKHGREGAG